MRRILAKIALAFAAAPAAATGSFVCSTAGKSPITLNIIVGHAVAPVVAQVSLSDGARSLSTAGDGERMAILQSWIDDKELRLDLVDEQVSRYEARLRIPKLGNTGGRGTLERNGRTLAVRCSGDR